MKNGPEARRSQKPCVFCENTAGIKITKEHIFSRWMHDLIPHDISETNEEAHARRRSASDPMELLWKRTRQGGVHTKTVRNLCCRCNSDWMNKVETETRPLLTSVIKHEPLLLKRAEQAALATWFTMKAIVLDGREEDGMTPVLSQSDAFQFQETRAIPGSITIWLGRSFHPTYAKYFFSQRSWVYRDGSEPFRSQSNLNLLCLAINGAITHIQINRSGLDVSKMIRVHPSCKRLHPYDFRIRWPVPAGITEPMNVETVLNSAALR